MSSGDVSEAHQQARGVRANPWLERFVLTAVWLYVVVTATFPYLYGNFVAVLLALALVACLIARLPFRRPVLWVAALVAVGVMGLLIGLARDNPGVRATSTIYIIEPLVIGLLFGLAWQFKGWRRTVTSALDGALVATVVMGCALYAATRHGTTLPAALIDPAFSAADMTGTTLRTNYQGFNALVFLAPYACLRVFLARDSSWLWRCVLMTSAVLGVVLAGRRVLYLTVPAVTIVAILILCVLARRWIKNPPGGRDLLRFAATVVVGTVAAGIIMTIVALSPGDALSRTTGQVSNTVNTTTGRGADAATGESDARAVQSESFMEAWEHSPLWGHGSGAVAPGEVRNLETPWAYELTYHLILYSFGILGSAVLLAWTLWMALQSWRRIRLSDALVAAVAAGWVGALLASVLDPYLLKIDGMWMVFIPFSLAVAAAADRAGDRELDPVRRDHNV